MKELVRHIVLEPIGPERRLLMRSRQAQPKAMPRRISAQTMIRLRSLTLCNSRDERLHLGKPVHRPSPQDTTGARRLEAKLES